MMNITILGSGTAVSLTYPSGYLLKHEGKNYLVDCSEGVRHRLARIGIDYFDIDAVFLSHFHPDHFNVETLIQSIMVRNYTEKTEKSLTVYGPPETKLRLKNIWDSKHNLGHFDKTLPDFIKLTVTEYVDRKAMELENLTVTPYFLAHGHMPAAALRFEFEDGKVFTYSGDSGVNEQVGEAAYDADLLLCECNQRPGMENPGHLNPREVGEIARGGNVKRVVLTHLPGADSDEIILSDIKKSGYQGSVKVGQNFDVLQLMDA